MNTKVCANAKSMNKSKQSAYPQMNREAYTNAVSMNISKQVPMQRWINKRPPMQSLNLEKCQQVTTQRWTQKHVPMQSLGRTLHRRTEKRARMQSQWKTSNKPLHINAQRMKCSIMQEANVLHIGTYPSDRWHTWNTSMAYIAPANRVKLWRPLPPTPTSNIWPPGCLRIRQILDTCSTANRKIAKFIGLLLTPLKSAKYDSVCFSNPETSVTSSYRRASGSSIM